MEFTTGELLLEERLNKGFTQKELAEKAGVAESTIQRLEAGDVKPHSETIRSLARALGVPYNFLLGKEFDEMGGGDADFETFDPTDQEGIGRFLY